VAENDIGIEGCHNPFTPTIMNFDMPPNFKFVIQIDPYDRMTDPQDHVEIFQQTMIFQGAKEPVISRAFPLTLKVTALRWFSSLPTGSITGWKALKDNFTSSK
jgi:predicted sugar kinase